MRSSHDEVGIYMEITNTPILELHAQRNYPAIDAVALTYLPERLLTHTLFTKEQIIQGFCSGKPVVLALLVSNSGLIANIALPFFCDDIYADKSKTIDLSLQAVEIAKNISAEVVSLTGLLPSALDYGHDLAKSAKSEEVRLTTGHATTVAAILMTIEGLLKKTDRKLSGEILGFLGLGSIGKAIAAAVLKNCLHPEKIILSDLYYNDGMLHEFSEYLINECNYGGDIIISPSNVGSVCESFYESSLIIGASNVPNILDIKKLRSGTMIVDDSAPLCFNLDDAIERYSSDHDILFIEGGLLRSPEKIEQIVYMPNGISLPMIRKDSEAEYEIAGCIMSCLLSKKFSLPTTLGQVDRTSSQKHYDKLVDLNFSATRLQCLGYEISADAFCAISV